MTTAFKQEGSFRPPYAFRNSEESIRRFPFPYFEDEYAYSMNLEPHVPTGDGVLRAAFDIDEHYLTEMRERAIALEKNPGMHYASLPHTMQAQWDLLELIFESYARDYPEHFTLVREGSRWTWENRLMGLRDTFTFGDPATLPYEPMEYATRQAQGEWIVVDDRDDSLYKSAGMATERADYSLRFNLGMSWSEWHGPVPLIQETGVLDRALKFLKRLRTGHPVRRLNWTLTVNPRLETSAETLHEWAPDRMTVTPENVGSKVHMRLELQPLHRLPRSNAIVFPVRTYFLSLDELVTIPKWARRTHRVLKSLNQNLIDYKGFSLYHQTMVDFLAQYDDGAPTSPGNGID
ncbi:heme-dependent oxidative N-demethylase family protein [Paraburkholderia bannensis]|uniref:heme-dependent oxidative N-demethylase family protein n=1 Tax=Paraburkholderia bannensis TaxID=765414 RepID=UPI0004880678|nr:DUF3445 domain-containing protein [Paraburkholderia bannensis]